MCDTRVLPRLYSTFKILAASLGHAGRPATEAIARRALLEPGFTGTDAIDRTPIAREQDRQWFADGLRRASVPE